MNSSSLNAEIELFGERCNFSYGAEAITNPDRNRWNKATTRPVGGAEGQELQLLPHEWELRVIRSTGRGCLFMQIAPPASSLHNQRGSPRRAYWISAVI
ncbi:hypothetical protein J6590_056931 [Homalodisca vitripennis]|nr:hypothetical protein J6590_056931 [Homalodisca vitripennis]